MDSRTGPLPLAPPSLLPCTRPCAGPGPPRLSDACWEPAPTALAENIPNPKVPPRHIAPFCSPHSSAHRIPQDALLYSALTSRPRPSAQTSVLQENPLHEWCIQKVPNKDQVLKVAWLLPEAWEHDARAHGPGLSLAFLICRVAF